MKSFKEYLIESKETYNFKIKVAGDCPEDCSSKIKEALGQYDCGSCSSGKSTPIQETQVDFPELKNVGVTMFEVSLNYPATSEQVRNLVAEKLGLSQSLIRVRNPKEEEEKEVNDQEIEQVLGKDYPKENNQNIVGEKHTMALLKELSKNKKQGEQYKGVNDKILAKKLPAEKTVKSEKQPAAKSPIGSSTIEKPTAASIRGK